MPYMDEARWAMMLDELQRYAVVDPAGDSLVLEKCLKAAMSYFENAGVPPQKNPLYDLGVYQLATHYYDNRGAAGEQLALLPYAVNSIINQLKL